MKNDTLITCHLCGKMKPITALNGINAGSAKQLAAYCRKTSECNSQRARSVVSKIAGFIKATECAPGAC